MYTNSVLAVTGALLSLVAAVPMAEHHQHHHKRDYVWVTHTEEAVVTVPVTKTVWIEPGETPPTEKQPQGYSPPAASSSPDVEPAATTAPAAPPAYTPEAPKSPAESSPDTPSVYVPPTTSSTSVYVAPTPTSTYVPPPPPTTYAAPTTTSAAAPASYPAPSSDSGSSSGGSGVSYGMAKSGTSYTGDLTYYAVGLGACGITSTEDEHIVAVAEAIFDSYDNGNPNNNPLCGKFVSITGANGEKYPAKIVDRCPGCAEADLDLPQAYFNTITNHADGRAHGMKWSFD